jgi:hypothetical protein
MKKTRQTERLAIETMAAFALAGAVACSSNNAPLALDGGNADASHVADAASDATETIDAGTTDATAGTVTLTVLNFLNWCSVTINGGTASTAASVTADVAVGSTATIVAMPASSAFQIGADPWFGVTENAGGAAAGTDTGSGATETSTATVVVSGTQCVSVCCQLPGNGPTPCPTTNPCP